MTINKICFILLCAVAFIGIATSCVLFFHGGYFDKVLVKLGLKKHPSETNWELKSWDSCLEKLDYDADVAFFGDSITRGGDFQDYFKNVKSVNLGLSGDTLIGMKSRVSMVKNTTPEKVFIMGGINSLTDNNIELCVNDYAEMIELILADLPDIDIYIQSVLPTSVEKTDSSRNNETVERFNNELKKLAEKKNCTYIDLFSLFCKDGEMNSDYSVDGMHINEKGYAVWAEAIADFVE